MSRTLSAAALWLFLTVLIVLSHASAQGPKTPLQKLPIEQPKDTPPYTAFPELKPPISPWDADVAKGEEFEAALKKYETARNELVFKGIPHVLPKNPTPLQKVQYERVRAGLAYIEKVERIIAMGRWNPQDYKDFLSMVSDVYQAAAELEPTLKGKVHCYEARVILMKEFENYTDLRVRVGSDPSQNTDLARFQRLQSEAELLKLKESVKDGK